MIDVLLALIIATGILFFGCFALVLSTIFICLMVTGIKAIVVALKIEVKRHDQDIK